MRCAYACASIRRQVNPTSRILRVDDLVCGYDFDAPLLPFGNQLVAAFGDDGLRGIADELDGCCVAF